MATLPRLSLIVPNPLLGALYEEATSKRRYPHLERLAARGSWQRGIDPAELAAGGLRPWQRSLLASLGLELFAARLASAPVVALATPFIDPNAYWMHAELVHLVAGIETLSMSMLASDELGVAEREALRASVAAHVACDGFELLTAPDGSWLIRSQRRFEVATCCPEVALAIDAHTAMPQGRDANPLRRLMTELQMLLHAHPVNVARESRGLRVANGIWLWGTGTLPPPDQIPRPEALPKAVGNPLFLQGLWQLLEHTSEPAALDGAELLARCAGRTLAVEPVTDVATLEAQWIAPLSRALAMRRLASLELVLEGGRLQIDRRALRRVWRRSRPLAEQLA
jgi:hypothetical protein